MKDITEAKFLGEFILGNKSNEEFEKILHGKLGEWLDTWCFKITLRHWKKKFSHFDESEFDLNMRSRKNVSKHHPQGFQNKVMELHQQKIKQLEQQFGITIV